MRRRWLHRTLWLLPLLVLGSTVLPATHRALHHGADATLPGLHVQADEACALCTATVSDEWPPLGGLVALAPASAPTPLGAPAPRLGVLVRASGRAPPAG